LTGRAAIEHDHAFRGPINNKSGSFPMLNLRGLLSVVVGHDKAGRLFRDGSRRREAAFGHVTEHVKQPFAFVGQRTFGSIISDVEGYQGVPAMQTRRGKEKRTDWRFTMEHIGYPPADTPPGLRALFTEERRRMSATRRNAQQAQAKPRVPLTIVLATL
jgi:hypothetical protein